jgi:outer membrane protein assembly factor BamB
VYCGSHDTYLYALYPNNGTLKWKYKTDGWIRVSPCIADDGTIYIVSLDNYLHALNPDGSLKWKTDVGAGTSPTIGQDGTIYAGYSKLHAVNPINGSVKWTFDVSGTMRGGTPCNSIDGTIYVGTSDGGEIIAINSDGTLKWRKSIGTCESAPAIGEDGVVYIGSYSGDCLYAFGISDLEADANGPYYELVGKPVQFTGYSKGGYSPHSYHWDFGDSHTSDEQNPTHIYANPGNYTVILTVTDNTSNTSSDTTWAWIQATNTPPNKPTINGPTKGEYGISYDYKFASTDQDGTPIWYYVDWGDNSNTGWFGPYNSGQEVTQSHFWYEKGTYTIRCKAKDPYNAESDWGTLKVTMPKGTTYIPSPFSELIERLMERFPHAFPILRYLLEWESMISSEGK